MHPADQNADPPVTIDVIQKVKPGREAEFEQVLADLIQAADAFEGYLGASIFRPSDRANPEYRIVFKFDHLSHLRQWENSPIRHKLLERAKQLTVGEGKWQTLTGLETWFTLATQQPIVPPPRYKMLIVTCLAAFPTLNVVNFLLQPLQPLPSLLRTLIATVILLTLMTYVIIPLLSLSQEVVLKASSRLGFSIYRTKSDKKAKLLCSKDFSFCFHRSDRRGIMPRMTKLFAGWLYSKAWTELGDRNG